MTRKSWYITAAIWIPVLTFIVWLVAHYDVHAALRYTVNH